MGERREQKKQETRQRISDLATGLFFARGFDAVTLEDVARAAKVSKMTVLNYFARKEELMLDREADLKLLVFREAIRDRPVGQSPIDALRGLITELSGQKHPLTYANPQSVEWWRVVSASPALRARLRELAEEASEALAFDLAGSTPDGRTRLVAGVIVMTVSTARQEAIRLIERGVSAKKANAAFLALIEQGFSAAQFLDDE